MESNKTNKPFVVGMVDMPKLEKTQVLCIAGQLQTDKAERDPRFPDHVFHVALAFGIKRMAMDLGFSSDEVYDPNYKEVFNEFFGMTPRKAMQTIGTMFRENFGKDIWLKYFESWVCENCKRNDIAFVTDIRFPNEADYIKEHFDCFLIKVERSSLDLTLPMYQHESELYVDSIKNFDVLIVNDTGLENLKPKAVSHIPTILEAFANHLHQK